MIQGFLEYVMRGRKQAAWLATLFVFLPFLGWVSNVILALVTLRVSILEGFYILLWISLPSLALAAWEYPGHLSLYIVSISGSLLSWVLASVLRTTANWRMVLWVMSAIGLISISLIYLLIPDIHSWLLLKLQGAINLAKQQGGLAFSDPAMVDALKPVVMKMCGLLVAAWSLSAIANVFIARGCQARLYNPGGFKKELRELRLSKLSAMVFMALLALSFTQWTFAKDSSSIICLPLVLIGLNLVHMLFTGQKQATWALVIFYVLLVFFFPLVAKLLVILALLDGLIDIQKKLKEVS